MFGLNLRYIINILLILFCCSLNLYLYDVKKNKKCPLIRDWRLNNGITLLNLLFMVTVINLFIPLHSFLSSLPLIGGWYIFIFVIWLFVILYIVTYISNKIKENIDDNRYKKCITEKTKVMYHTFKNNTTITNLMVSPIFTVLYFYAIKN